MRWSKEEVELAIKLAKSGDNFKEIGEKINKSHVAVSSKLSRLGVKSGFLAGANKGVTKYCDYDWVRIQEDYNKGQSQYDIIKLNESISLSALYWGIKNGKFKTRNLSECLKLSWKNGRTNESKQQGINRYRQLCEFKFNVFHYPQKFDLELIERYGWYKAKNRGDNPNGVSRDHMYSIKEGYLNGIDPELLNHPANCQLLTQVDNNRKKIKCSISLEELIERVENWK